MADLITFILKYQYEVGTESAGIGYGEEVYEEMMLHPSLEAGESGSAEGEISSFQLLGVNQGSDQPCCQIYPCDPGIPKSLIYPEFPMNGTALNWIANYIWGIAERCPATTGNTQDRQNAGIEHYAGLRARDDCRA